MMLRQLWPDVVDHLRSAIRAGLPLPEALIQLGTKGPEELRPVFRDFGADYRAGGQFDGSLTRLKDRLADPVADRIVEALRLTREVGGTDLGRLLGTLAEFLRESARTRSELEARQSWTINAARLAVAAPWIVLMLLATRPEAVHAYNTPMGAAVLLGGLVVSLTCYSIMLKIGALATGRTGTAMNGILTAGIVVRHRPRALACGCCSSGHRLCGHSLSPAHRTAAEIAKPRIKAAARQRAERHPARSARWNVSCVPCFMTGWPPWAG